MPLPERPRTLFAVHRFEGKLLEDSAGLLEIARPMEASGLLGETRLVSFGRANEDYDAIVRRSVDRLVAELGREPVVVYGAGAHTIHHWSELGRLNVVALADRDTELWGQQRLGVPIVAPAAIAAHASHVVISSRAYEASIEADLGRLHGERVTSHVLYGRDADRALAGEWERALLEAVDAFRPDLLVHTPVHPRENLSAEVFHAIKRAHPHTKLVTVWWDYDEDATENSYLDYERETLTWADLVIENSNGTRLERMRARVAPYERHEGAEKVIFHPSVFDPAHFFPEPEAEPLYDIAIFGSSVGRRRVWIDALRARYGDRFHHIGGVNEAGRAPIPTAEYAAALRRTKICVNTQTYPFRLQCKGKVREALACGVMLLEEDNPETRLILQEGEGVAYFTSEASLFESVDRLLANEDERRAIVVRGERKWVESMRPSTWTKTLLAAAAEAQPRRDT
jgi:hypothetical protein